MSASERPLSLADRARYVWANETDRVRYWWTDHVGLIVTTTDLRRRHDAEMFSNGLEVGQQLAERAGGALVRHLHAVHD